MSRIKVAQRQHAGAIVAIVNRCDEGAGDFYVFEILQTTPPAIVPTYRTREAAQLGCDVELERKGHRCDSECGVWRVNDERL